MVLPNQNSHSGMKSDTLLVQTQQKSYSGTSRHQAVVDSDYWRMRYISKYSLRWRTLIDVENVVLLESVRMNLSERSIDELRFKFLCLRFAWNTLKAFNETEKSYIFLRVKIWAGCDWNLQRKNENRAFLNSGILKA